MQKCNCGKEIKYVAVGLNKSVKVNAEEKIFYTITGREGKRFQRI